MGGLMSKQPRAGADDGGRGTVSRLAEVGTLLTRLLAYLAPYRRGRFTAADGTVYETPYLLPVGGTTVTATTEHPLLCVSAATEALPRRVRVVAGSIGGLSSPFSPGDDPVTYVTAVSGSGFIYATLTVDSSPGYPVSLTITAAASVPADTQTVAHLTLASTSYSLEAGLAVASFLTGSQDYVRCNSPWDAAYYAHSFTVI